MAITMAGTGSGLDLESIISTFVSAERAPKEARLNEKEITINTEFSGVGTLRSALADFKDITARLGNTDTFYQSKTFLSYQGSKQESGSESETKSSLPISIKASGVVPKGTFDVKVNQLASGSRLESTYLPARSSTIGAGVANFSAGSETFNITIAATDTLQDIQKLINDAPDNFGVSANIISSDLGAKIIYTSEQTGAANNLSVTSINSGLGIITSGMVGDAATDAIIEVDGSVITQANNTFDKAVSGVAITANSLTEGLDTVTFSTATNPPAIKELVTDFVEGYNALMSQINTLTHPETGSLKFDSTARGIKQQMQMLTGSEVTGTTGRLNTLYSAGISLEEGGVLAINPFGSNGGKSGEERLNEAISSSLGDLGKLFAGTGGVATKLDGLLANSLDSKGTISQRQTLLNSGLRELEDDRADLDRYIESFEDTLRQKYTALDSTVSRYNATRDYLSSQLG